MNSIGEGHMGHERRDEQSMSATLGEVLDIVIKMSRLRGRNEAILGIMDEADGAAKAVELPSW